MNETNSNQGSSPQKGEEMTDSERQTLRSDMLAELRRQMAEPADADDMTTIVEIVSDDELVNDKT